MHAESLWQCDFFSRRILTRHGIRQAFALVFLNVATRRVWVSSCTRNPTVPWVEQQAKSFMDYTEQNEMKVDLLTRDRDWNYRKAFDKALADRGARVMMLAYRSPKLNAYVERFVPSIQQECLDHFLIFSEQHFDYLVREYVEYYHQERPHQGLENKLLRGEPSPAPPESEIHCRTRLGGLLKHYCRAAA